MEIKYGGQTVQFDTNKIPGLQILTKPAVPGGIKNLKEAFSRALEQPTAGPSLRERLLESRPERLAIIVEDKTRKNPEYPELLDGLIIYIQSVCRCQIFLVVAYGSHLPHTSAENIQLYGQKNLDRVTLIAHDARNPKTLTDLGPLPSGHVLFLNQTVAAADFIISFGDITPHGFAGFSGGRKAILPGVCGFHTIERNHTLVSDPNTRIGKLEGNRLHLEMMEAANQAGLGFIINSVRNPQGEIVALVSGLHQPAFAEGVRICREINGVAIGARAEVVFVSCGGFPKDKSLYHAQRAIIAAVSAVKQGGTIVVFGKFPEGVGDELYETWLPKPLAEILALKPEEIRLGVHSAYLMARNLSWAEIILYTDLNTELAESLHFRKFDSLDRIMEYLNKKHGSNYTSYLIPNGSQILIQYE